MHGEANSQLLRRSPALRSGPASPILRLLLHHSGRDTAPTFFLPGTEDYYVGTLSGLRRLYLEPTPEGVNRRPSSR